MAWHATKRQLAYIRVLVNRLGWGNDPDTGIIHVLGTRPPDNRFSSFAATQVISCLKALRNQRGANHPVKNLPRSYLRRNRERRERGRKETP